MKSRSRFGDGRLQRSSGASGVEIDSFALVFIRHGLTVGVLCAILIVLGIVLDSGSSSSAYGLRQTMGYDGLIRVTAQHLWLMLFLFGFFLAYWGWQGININRKQLTWLLYLGYISVVEELVFRLFAPQLLQHALSWPASVIISNLIFACLHFLTLRWRAINCLAVLLGGLGLSRLLQVTDDFSLVVLVHFFFTFLNTPSPPAGRN